MKEDKGNKLEETAQEYFMDPTNENLEALVDKAKGLIICFSRKFGLGKLQEDLVQAGYEGLLKAVQSYDPERGVLFSTYASHWIMGKIRHEIRDNRKFECPTCVIELQDKIASAVDDYFKENGSFPSRKIISNLLKVSEEGIIEAMQGGLVSLEELDLSKLKSTSQNNFQLPIEDKILLYRALNKINILQRKVLYLLFFGNKTQKEIAEILGTNQRQVSRLKEKGLKEIKEELEKAV